MNKVLSTVGIVPLLWYAAVPHAPKYCIQDENGNYTVSFVTSDFLGRTISVQNSPSQVKLCQEVQNFHA